VDPKDAFAELGRTTFIDVREPHEYEAAHIEGAVLIPLGQIVARLGEIPKSEPVIVACRSGQRSGLVAEHLNVAGYEAHNLEGGLVAWAAAGYPLVAAGPPEA